MTTIKRIGVLTGGGDCPGLNAVIRAVTKTAMYEHGIRVFGIADGYEGLDTDGIRELSSFHVSGVLTKGGTILGTSNKYDPTRVFVGRDADGEPQYESRLDRCLANIRKHELDALVVIGGDGTMSIAAKFVEAGVTCMGVPKTIDNDIEGTDLTFGFLTATDTATDALDRLHSTAESHHRVIVCEVMGRNAGWIALHSGIASGSDVILIPEIPFDYEAIAGFVENRRHRGRDYAIVVAAEGARAAEGAQVVAFHDESSPDPVRLGGIANLVAQEIAERTGFDTRTTVLGHIQRGGTPIPTDRVLATQFGHHAMKLLLEGRENRLVVWKNGTLNDIAISEVANKQRTVPLDHPLIGAARALRTSFGERSDEAT